MNKMNKTKDFSLGEFLILLMLGLIAGILLQIGDAVLLLVDVNMKELELTDETLKLEWQIYGPDLEEFYPQDDTCLFEDGSIGECYPDEPEELEVKSA